MRQKRKVVILGVLLMLFGILGVGCKVEEKNDKKLKEMDFSVVSDKEIPEELKKIVAGKKKEEMKMTYLTDDSLYIIRGYGTQDTGGYSIQVKELYQAKNAVYFETELVGPGEKDVSKRVESYPYIVVKTEKTEDVVVFE